MQDEDTLALAAAGNGAAIAAAVDDSHRIPGRILDLLPPDPPFEHFAWQKVYFRVKEQMCTMSWETDGERFEFQCYLKQCLNSPYLCARICRAIYYKMTTEGASKDEALEFKTEVLKLLCD